MADGGVRARPVFVVTVDGVSFRSHRATAAWQMATRRELRERKKLKVHANEGQCDNVTEMFMACSYSIDGDYMFGVTGSDGAGMLRVNPSGCARAEAFRRKKKMSTAKVQRTADQLDPEDSVDVTNLALMTHMYNKLRQEALSGEARTQVQRSCIHNLGLFATRDIKAHDMVIEYVGELVRTQVGDLRDERALEKGKSTYMFRIDEDLIVDAMFAGSASRYLNHSCQPNSCAKIVEADGSNHIVVFAMRGIRRGEEVTYDYKLPCEPIKIPCHCGAPECRGYLN